MKPLQSWFQVKNPLHAVVPDQPPQMAQAGLPELSEEPAPIPRRRKSPRLAKPILCETEKEVSPSADVCSQPLEAKAGDDTFNFVEVSPSADVCSQPNEAEVGDDTFNIGEDLPEDAEPQEQSEAEIAAIIDAIISAAESDL